MSVRAGVVNDVRVDYRHVPTGKGIGFAVQQYLSVTVHAQLNFEIVVPILLVAEQMRGALQIRVKPKGKSVL
jgi:hypothetical protein